MKILRNATLATVFMVVAASVMSVSAQGPLHKQVFFTISHPFEMRSSNVVLPAGKYILYQVSKEDLNLFALYKENLMHSPLAMVRTTRIDYSIRRNPNDVMMLVSTDEEANQVLPVINGWAIPGMDGWEIIAMVPNHERISMAGNGIARNGFSRNKHKKTRVYVVTTASASGF
jgi:hypothetical protein